MATTFNAQPAQQVNTTTAGDQLGARMAVLPSGGHVVAWNSDGNVLAQLYDASGARLGSEMTLFTGNSLGGIAALADGTLVASASRSWYDPATGQHSTLYFERLDAGGHVVVGPTVVDDSGNYDTWVSGGEVYAMPGGGFAVTDVHTSRPTPLSFIDDTIRVYDASNTFTGTSIAASQNFLQETAQMRSGGFVTEGNTNFGPTPVSSSMWRSMDAQGHQVASVAFPGSFANTGYDEGGVVGLADGRALVTWRYSQYDGSVPGTLVHQEWQAQWLDASGRPTGGVFTLNAAADTSAMHLTALADGGFVATWTHYTGYNTPYDLYAQHFNASAQPDSGAIKLTTLAYNLAGYEVDATADGGFLVAFERVGDGADVWQQKFDVAATTDSGPSPAASHYPGIDEVSYALPHTDYTVTQDASAATIVGPDGTDVLTGIERIRFSDGYAIALDVKGDAGQAYRLYQAAFDRAPDLAGLGFQTNDLDMGYSLAHVAQNFIDSPEFQSKYGPSLDNTQFITLLYQHVLHRDPEAAGLQYHLNEFTQGDTRANMLTHFSESPENQANVIGQIGNGMLFIPYV